MNILLSRTDSIGDVILTIPMAGYIKQKMPEAKVFFLGKTYTKAIVESSEFVDEFINWDDLSSLTMAEQVEQVRNLQLDWFIHVFPNKVLAQIAKKAGVANRIGTSHRTFHWLSCNHRLDFSRKKSELHESQLNFKLLAPLGLTEIPKLDLMPFLYGMKAKEVALPFEPQSGKVNIILHPKSKGSAREWGLDNFAALINLLPPEKYKIYVSGTADDKANMSSWLEENKEKVEDITGKLSLEQFIYFIGKADVLVAASTGPLHIAAALGKKAIGLYPPIKPMHPGRWKPIGKQAEVLVKDKNCDDCRKLQECACMKSIRPEDVVRLLELY